MKKFYLLVLAPNLVTLGAGFFFLLGTASCNFDVLVVLGLLCAGGASIVAALVGLAIGMLAGREGVGLGLASVACLVAYGVLYVAGPDLRAWGRAMDFSARQAGYLEVVALVRQGQIVPDQERAAVDAAHQSLLACGPQIGIDRNERGLFVLFFTSHSWFEEFSGYMYVEDGQPPTIQEFRELRRISPDVWTVVEPVETHWFYVVWSH